MELSPELEQYDPAKAQEIRAKIAELITASSSTNILEPQLPLALVMAVLVLVCGI